jgi:hypothetical protein
MIRRLSGGGVFIGEKVQRRTGGVLLVQKTAIGREVLVNTIQDQNSEHGIHGMAAYHSIS